MIVLELHKLPFVPRMGSAWLSAQSTSLALRDSMGRILLIAVLLFSAQSSPAEEPLPAEDIAFTSRYDGTEQRYVVIKPKGFDPSGRNHVLVALHGHGSDRWQFVKDARGECRAARDAAAQHGFLFISPDYRARTSWMGPAATADVQQILQDHRRDHPHAKIIVSGGSMGGTSAVAFAVMHPELVDGVVSLNGTANMLEYDQFSDAIAASYGGTKAEKPEVYRQRSAELHAEKLTMPIAFTTGGQDQLVPPDSTLRLVRLLEERRAMVHLIHRPDGGHATNYEDSRATFEFVFAQVMKAEK